MITWYEPDYRGDTHAASANLRLAQSIRSINRARIRRILRKEFGFDAIEAAKVSLVLYEQGKLPPNYQVPAKISPSFEYWRNLGEVSALNKFNIEGVASYVTRAWYK